MHRDGKDWLSEDGRYRVERLEVRVGVVWWIVHRITPVGEVELRRFRLLRQAREFTEAEDAP